MSGNDVTTDGFECIEPDLGDQMWRLEGSDSEPLLRERLIDHLAYCDACRLKQGAVQHLQRALADGDVELSRSVRRRAPLPSDRRYVGVIQKSGAWGGLALAAGIAMMLLLPPEKPGDDLTSRSGPDTARFLEPVESQVVSDRTPRIAWTGVEGASGYQLTLEAEQEEYHLSETTSETSLRIPAETALPEHALIRACLETIPPDLGPLGGISLTFRTGSPTEALGHRLQTASLYSRLLTGFGLLVMLVSAVAMLSGRIRHDRARDAGTD
ncbi:hypothetical protein H8E07_03775 [bacterium]|nr:hypothetical protein [bacterium]